MKDILIVPACATEARMKVENDPKKVGPKKLKDMDPMQYFGVQVTVFFCWQLQAFLCLIKSVAF